MALIEIEEAEVASARAAKNLLDRAYNNPKTKRQLLRVAKELYPDATIPELEVVDEADEKLKALRDELLAPISELKSAFETRAAAEEVESRIRGEQDRLRKEGWDEDGLKKIEDLMVKRGLADYDAAAALLEKEMAANASPVESVADISSRSFGIDSPDEGDEDHKFLLADRGRGADRWASKKVSQILNESRRAKAARR